MGLTPQEMPPMNVFKPLCDALKANGYDAERTANLWFKCINNDISAIEELQNNTGAYGIILFGKSSS